MPRRVTHLQSSEPLSVCRTLFCTYPANSGCPGSVSAPGSHVGKSAGFWVPFPVRRSGHTLQAVLAANQAHASSFHPSGITAVVAVRLM